MLKTVRDTSVLKKIWTSWVLWTCPLRLRKFKILRIVTEIEISFISKMLRARAILGNILDPVSTEDYSLC